MVILATYTGHETKILMNMNKPITKKTVLTDKLGYTVLGIFIYVLIISLVIGLSTLEEKKKEEPGAVHFIRYWSSWILNIAYLIPNLVTSCLFL